MIARALQRAASVKRRSNVIVARLFATETGSGGNSP
jgi:hypothetical protein